MSLSSKYRRWRAGRTLTVARARAERAHTRMLAAWQAMPEFTRSGDRQTSTEDESI